MTTYGYLGPEGTFAEAALLASLGVTEEAAGPPEGVELRPYAGVAAAIAAVRSGEVAASMVPVENSVEGAVAQTLDELATGQPLTVVGEAVLPVTFALLARPGTTLGDVRRVGTHPHAEAQTRRWFAEHLPGVAVVPTTSTAAAAAALADGTAQWDGAVSAPFAASVYGLAVLAEGVGDNPSAETRFVLVSGPAAPPAATGADKTSLVLYIGQDHPGALMEILTEFAVRGINLTRIESRPTGGGIGDYFFSIDCEGHVDDARVGEALMGLRRVCAEVRFLGSFPRVDGVRPILRRGVSDEEYRDAQAWLARVREGRP
ncbi:MAG TPA: prephenate dehydratase [Actinomycetes bacterium]|nr:prephenate dehydratase [Actinomycetes bacterium]